MYITTPARSADILLMNIAAATCFCVGAAYTIGSEEQLDRLIKGVSLAILSAQALIWNNFYRPVQQRPVCHRLPADLPADRIEKRPPFLSPISSLYQPADDISDQSVEIAHCKPPHFIL